MKQNKIHIKRARAAGMCFGVRDALAQAAALAETRPLTVLGQLVHNPEVDRKLETLGVEQLNPGGSGRLNPDQDYLITAHGVSESQRQSWKEQGIRVHDGTCPLVHRAHAQLRDLVQRGFHPVVIGLASHVEVKGLAGDYPHCHVILEKEQVENLPRSRPLGIVAQTTQPLPLVLELVAEIRLSRPDQQVEFIDTVCQPTKRRQEALQELCREADLVIVVGGKHSNNTRQLLETARSCGCLAYQVESQCDLRSAWFEEVRIVGLTAGTSTLDETVDEIEQAIIVMDLSDNLEGLVCE